MTCEIFKSLSHELTAVLPTVVRSRRGTALTLHALLGGRLAAPRVLHLATARGSDRRCRAQRRNALERAAARRVLRELVVTVEPLDSALDSRALRES